MLRKAPSQANYLQTKNWPLGAQKHVEVLGLRCLHSTEGQFHLDVLSDFHRGTQRRQVLDVASNLQVSTSDPIATQQHV